MRLDLETPVTAPPVSPAFNSENYFTPSHDFQKLLQKGIAAAKNGEREDARELLMQATEIDAFNEDAWMWLASISEYPEELIAFLNNVLTINPDNERAVKWLAETECLLARPDEVSAGISVSYTLEETHASNYSTDGIPCPFCAEENNAYTLRCRSCRAVLSLSDIDLLLSDSGLDRSLIRESLAEMETEWDLQTPSDKQLTALGMGHFNLQNFDEGLRYFHDLLDRDPNNVILSGQLNAIAIRLDEMRHRSECAGTRSIGKTILVVDDSATVRKLLAGKLEKCGHHVVCAVDGVDALEKVAEHLPDMIFLDISMPRMDGYEVCKRLRSDPLAKDVPIVMISGKDGFFDKVRGKIAGANGYVAKPFGPDMLMKTLETYLAEKELVAEH